MFDDFIGYLESITFRVEIAVVIFGQPLVEILLLFSLTSGHTAGPRTRQARSWIS